MENILILRTFTSKTRKHVSLNLGSTGYIRVFNIIVYFAFSQELRSSALICPVAAILEVTSHGKRRPGNHRRDHPATEALR